ncbi:DUF3742 family protein [Pseudomonas sp. GWSMS-1]|uniref:DUF3742 family protein n=1 Tax=Pseudomonas sp. GWSMS-1 TaxID=3308997 RepID=UPI003CE70109
MTVTRPATASRASRWAYACGMALKRGYRRINAFELRLAERAAAGVPVGKPLVRGGFLIAKLTLVGVLFFISFWLVASVVAMLAVIALLQLRAFIGVDVEEEDSGPDYLGADLYIGDFDDKGHYIGGSKSSS